MRSGWMSFPSDPPRGRIRQGPVSLPRRSAIGRSQERTGEYNKSCQIIAAAMDGSLLRVHRNRPLFAPIVTLAEFFQSGRAAAPLTSGHDVSSRTSPSIATELALRCRGRQAGVHPAYPRSVWLVAACQLGGWRMCPPSSPEADHDGTQYYQGQDHLTAPE
jgi:hypothetical protein